jgi:WD40 repeat protein
MSHSSPRCIPVPGRILVTAFSPDGRLLAVSGVQSRDVYHVQSFLQVYEAHTLECVQTVPPVSDFPFTCITWSPGSTQLALAGPAGTISVWDCTSGTVLRAYYGHSPEVASLPLASIPVRREVLACCWPTDDQIVSAGKDTCMCQWNPQSGETTRRLVYQDFPELVSFSPSGASLAIIPPLMEQAWQDENNPLSAQGSAVNLRGKVGIFEVSTGRTTAALPGTEACFCAAWATKTGLLALGSWEEILIWDLQSSGNPHLMHTIPRRLFGEALSRYQCHPLAWSPDGMHLAYCAVLEHAPFSSHWDDERSERALIEILDVRSGTTVYSVPVTGVFCLAWAPDGKRLVVGRNMEFEVLTGPFSSDSTQGTR